MDFDAIKLVVRLAAELTGGVDTVIVPQIVRGLDTTIWPQLPVPDEPYWALIMTPKR